jgi:undecaprenyl-diphosphatase
MSMLLAQHVTTVAHVAASHGHRLTWPEAIVIGLLQGVSELFPVSSLGHSVLIPALVGGSWAKDLDVAAPESPYLAFIVGLHVATAIALIAYFWRDWVRIVRGLWSSVRERRIETPDQRLGWLLVVGTIPVGLVGLVFEHTFRVRFGTPTSAGIFLALNGLLLLGVEEQKKRQSPAPTDETADQPDRDVAVDQRLGRLSWATAFVVGASQIAALFAGLSRSGAAISAGLLKGLSHEDASRFAFLLATPVILAAGVLKLPDLTGPLGRGIGGQVLVGSILSGVGAYISVRFLDRYFTTRSLRPFGIYCLVAGVGASIYLAAR